MSELVKRTSTNNPAVQTPLGSTQRNAEGPRERTTEGQSTSALAEVEARLVSRMAAVVRREAKAEVADERERMKREMRQPLLAADDEGEKKKEEGAVAL